MKRISIGIGLVSVGVLLVVMSLFWVRVIPAESVWSEEKAEAYQTSSLTLHKNTFDDSISEEELAQSQVDYDKLRAQLDRARGAKYSLPKYFRIGGIAATIVGVALLLIQKTPT